MKKLTWFTLFLGFNLFLFSFSSHAAESTGIQSEGVESAVISEETGEFEFKNKFKFFSEWLDNLVLGHLELGTRFVYFKITDNLDEDQDYNPTRVFLDWIFWNSEHVSLGTEITWDRVEVRQTNDSKVSTSGPIWTLIARYNNDTLFIPYAGLGAAFYDSTDFVGTFGSSIKLSTNWEADVYGRYTDITIDEVPDEFDLSTMTYGIGIKYVFG